MHLGQIVYSADRSTPRSGRPTEAGVTYIGTRTLRAPDGSHYEDPIFRVVYRVEPGSPLEISVDGICLNLAKFHADCLVGNIGRF